MKDAANGSRATRQWMLWAYKLRGCVDCGKSYPDVPLSELHCHHRDPATKRRYSNNNVLATGGGLATSNGEGYWALLNELLKCDVLCAECHKQRHRNGKDVNGYVQMALFTGTGVPWKASAGA